MSFKIKVVIKDVIVEVERPEFKEGYSDSQEKAIETIRTVVDKAIDAAQRVC